MPASVLLFDSGVGALSLVSALDAALPGASLVYASDNAAHPYGTLDEAVLTSRVDRVLTELTARYSPDLLIVACNTASTVALPRLRSRLSVPVVGVVPAIKPAAAISRSGHIALLATPATVNRPYTQALIDEFAPHCTVLRLGSLRLVELAEARLRGEPVASTELAAVLAPLFEDPRFERVDTAVLGCTHFPLLAAELAAAVPRPLTWVDSGEAVARRAAQLLESAGASRTDNADRLAVFTGNGGEPARLAPALARFGFERAEVAELPFRRP